MMELLSQAGPTFLFIGTIFAGVIFYRPYAGILSLALMIPLEPILTFSAGFTAIKAIGVITFAAFIFHVFFGKENIEIDRRIYIPLIFFSLWAILTMKGNYSRLFMLAQLLALFIMTIGLCYKNDRRLILIIWAIFVGCFIASCMAASGFLGNDSARASLEGQNANKYALMASIGIIISLFLKDRLSKGRWNVLILGILYGAIILFVYGLVTSASRGSIVALCMSFLIYLAGNKNRLKSGANILVILLLVSTVLVVGLRKGLITEYSVNRIKALQSIENDTSMAGRFILWRVGWKIAKQNLLTGVGLGNFPSAYAKYTGRSGSRVFILGSHADPHSTYISILVETGIIGFLLFMWFLGSLFFLILKNKSEKKIFALCILTFIAILPLTHTYHFTKAYWICIALSYLIYSSKPQYLYLGEDLGLRVKEEGK